MKELLSTVKDNLGPILIVLTIVTSAIALYVSGKFKVLETNLKVFAESNQELRDALDFHRTENARTRAEDAKACDEQIIAERAARILAQKDCDITVARLQGQVDVLTNTLVESVATKAALRSLEIQQQLGSGAPGGPPAV